ncbi:hypothetical protein CEP54_009630 [Fusarium duplospermum]|uniref:Nephrocystin 3-like N-terminal domain-containing protein n=1 Tax=Fusarium duplospermum TaxID=1325734 RepID=A0A428PPG0_9HYPO|nr:hypothetical protein CEP54_009630 [Fusarium duplospermum]
MADPFQDIYTTAVECKDLFVQFLSKNTADSEQMIDHQHRFMSWASYLGVFAPGPDGFDGLIVLIVNFKFPEAPESLRMQLASGGEDSLLQHLVSAHSRDVQESERQAIVTRSKAAIPSELALCALCNQDVRSIPTATSSKSTVDDEEEPRRGTPELSKGQDPGKLKGEKEPPITFSETSKKPIPMGASKAGVRFDLPPEHREPHSTATTTEAGPRSDVSVGREDFGSIQAKLHNHLADHLRSLSFLSLRWWDEERNSGSQDSGEARGRGDADSNSSQDLGDSENDDTPTADPKVLADCLKSLAFPEMYNQFSTVAPADDNTCQWLFLHEAWNSWASSDSSLLYIKGKDGSGKSTLLRYALHHISEAPNIQKEAIVLSFFFNRHGTELQRTSLGLFRSLLYQLLCEIPDEMHDLIGIFEDRRKENGEPGVKWHWTVHDLLSFFEAILPDIARSRPVWLFVDDLDESEHETELVQIFKSLLRMPLPFHICITYGPLVRIDSDCEFQIRVEQGNREDISTYVRHRLSEQNFSRLGSLITNEAEGVFLWVVILMEYILELEKRGETPNRIADAIITLPWNLDNLYLQRIRSAAHPASPKLIKWICLATRTLSLRELRWAMLVDSDTPHASLRQCEVAANFPADEVGMTKMIREISGGLVNTVQASHTNPSGVASTQVAQFVHPSIRDFFLGKGLSDLAFKITEAEVNKADFAVEMSQVQLSLTCIRYLAMEEMDCVSVGHQDISWIVGFNFTIY